MLDKNGEICEKSGFSLEKYLEYNKPRNSIAHKGFIEDKKTKMDYHTYRRESGRYGTIPSKTL